jgi:hypothetical protein
MQDILPAIEVYPVHHLPIIKAYADQLGLVSLINHYVPTEMAMDAGMVVLGLVLDTLSGRSLLYCLEEFFAHEDTALLLGKALPLQAFTDDTVGRVLDRLYDFGTMRLYTACAVRAVTRFGIERRYVYFDTTSYSVWGAYEFPEAQALSFRITYGYSKEKRPDLKQFVLSTLCGSGGADMGQAQRWLRGRGANAHRDTLCQHAGLSPPHQWHLKRAADPPPLLGRVSTRKPTPGPPPDRAWGVAAPSLSAGSWRPHSPCLIRRLRCLLFLPVGGEVWPSGVSCTPSASRCCLWAASLAMAACGTPTRFVAVAHAARSRSALVASTARPAATCAAVCARGLPQAPSGLQLPAHSCAIVCRGDSAHGPIVSPSVCPSGSERLAEVCGPSPHASPARERPPACGLRIASRAHGQPPGARVGLRPRAATTPRVHAPRDCGTIAFDFPILGRTRA